MALVFVIDPRILAAYYINNVVIIKHHAHKPETRRSEL